MVAASDTMVQLTEEQQDVYDAVRDWVMHPAAQQKTVGGYAGVGKTVLISALLRDPELRKRAPAVATYTGKAASVLISKGVNAGTIHSLIYVPKKDEKGRLTFQLRPAIDADVVVIDEASMVPQALYDDLMGFNVPVLFVGDMGQLEPIGDDPRLMRDPEHKLTTIHRQALDSPIIRLSQQIREKVPTFRWMKGDTYSEDELVLGDRRRFWDALDKVDQVICGYNKTRHAVNTKRREQLGYKDRLCVGDRVICLQNDRQFGVFNGLMGEVVKVHDGSSYTTFADVKDDLGRVLEYLPMEASQFGANAKPYEERRRGITYWDYGYAVTTHKSQGSQWDRVAVIEELHPKWDAARWRYTAVTRAAKKLLYFR